ncbi:MAG: type II toxin-antitoxin system RelE/ParE family toxin [Raoultibacter sp.]
MKIRYTPAAIHDLDEIEAYIRDVLVNPTAALDVISSIADDIELLKEQPLLGAEFSSKIKRDIRERYLISGNYIVVYAVEGLISILRIRDTRTNYLKIIFR